MNDKLLAGSAKEITTPPIGTLLYGYTPDMYSDSVHDDLSVTSLAISQHGKTALLITAEIGDMQTALCDETREKISDKTCVPKEHIIIASTHTHSAPNLSGTVGWGELNRDYYDSIFLPAILTAAEKSIKALAPCEISVGVTESLVGINRRQQHKNGVIGLGQNPYGCFDPNMTLISFRNAETKEGILNLIHYGCHGTATGCNHEITRDWSGIMIDRLEKETHTLTAFFNGAIGDVGPRLTNGETTGNISYTEELGGVAAADALRAYKNRGVYHSAELKILTDTVHLPYKEMPSIAETEQRISKFSEPEKLINIDKLEYEHYKETLEFLRNPTCEIPESFSFPQTIISLGGIVFIPFPFEMFSEIVMRLREYSPYTYTLCLSCANGYNVYLPSEDQLCRGGYEVGCFMYGHLFPLAENTDQNIINENLRIISEVDKCTE